VTAAAAGGAAPYYASPSGDVVLHRGDAAAVLRALPAGSVHAVITSPPFLGLRDYGIPPSEWPAVEYAPLPGLPSLTVPVPAMSCCLGLEPTVEAFVGHLVLVFRALRRVMRDDAVAFLNLGDSYATRPVGTFNGGGPALTGRNLEGHHFKSPVDKSKLAGVKPKDLLEIPSLVVLALRADGWWLRSRSPWIKRNPMPESADDRPSSSTEYVFLLSKAATYFYDADAVRVPGGTTTEQATTKWATRREGRGKGQRQGVYHPGAAPFANDPHPAGRNRRNADWWFDSLRAILDGATGLLADEDGDPLALPVNPAAYPGAHFATFAPRLVEPMLLASTSARGCCPKCGAPWVRANGQVPASVLGDAVRAAREARGLTREQLATALGKGANNVWDWEVGGHIPRGREWDGLAAALGLALTREQFIERAEYVTTGRQAGPKQQAGSDDPLVSRPYAERKLRLPPRDLGWRAGCACEDAGDPTPCTVLDPFCGSGTVPLVARKHGRHGWGIDLSAAYLDLARERLGQLALPGWSGAAAGG
jgi:transcriptional regulator with XRE-family HTH domain